MSPNSPPGVGSAVNAKGAAVGAGLVVTVSFVSLVHEPVHHHRQQHVESMRTSSVATVSLNQQGRKQGMRLVGEGLFTHHTR